MFRRALALAVLVGLSGCSSSSALQSGEQHRSGERATRVVGGFRVESSAMVPALEPDQHVQAVAVARPKRGDVLVFETPSGVSTTATKLLGRVVGLPGETIEGRSGLIYIEGAQLDEPYLAKGIESKTFGPVQVPSDSLYMLGDNRQYAADSTVYGPVRRALVVGRIET